MTEAPFGVPGLRTRAAKKVFRSNSKEKPVDVPTLHRIITGNCSVQEQIRSLCSEADLPSDRFTQVLLALIEKRPDRNSRRKQNYSVLPLVAPEKYAERKILADGSRENIVDFLSRTWKPWIRSGVLTRADLRKLDVSADRAYDNWIHSGHVIPDDLKIPTKKEAIDRFIASDPKRALATPRYQKIIASRLQRGVQIPGITI